MTIASTTMRPTTTTSRIPDIVGKHQSDILREWTEQQLQDVTVRRDLMKEDELREQSRKFLKLFSASLQNGGAAMDIDSPGWADMRDMLSDVSKSRARQGFTPSETASFVFSLKQPLFARLRQELVREPETLATETWTATVVLDELGLRTTELYQKGREEVIARQQREMMELSTPVVQLWEGIVAVPLIGTLDSSRTQVVMENLLEKIVDTGAAIAIIDITGVPTVDTLVAQHLLKTVAAARLMGAECIISGIRPQIAQTIVHLGVDLGPVVTKATLADAFAIALKRSGRAVTREQGAG
jgi:rsbT co-antagonist protein RsbR